MLTTGEITSDPETLRGVHTKHNRKEKSKDLMSAIELRLDKAEAIVAETKDHLLTLEDETRDGIRDELRDELQGVLNSAIGEVLKLNDALEKRNEALERRNDALERKNVELEAQVEGLAKQLSELMGEFKQQRMAWTSGAVTHPHIPKIDVPNPKSYGGTRNARELDNFLWNLERYFDAMGVRDNDSKLLTVPLFLQDVATLWWLLCEDIKKGTCTIDT